MLASAEALTLLPVTASGTASIPLVVPNDPTFVFQRLYGQHLVLHPGAKTLGMLVTAGSELRIGN